MIRLPPRSTRTDTLFPYTTLFRSTGTCSILISACPSGCWNFHIHCLATTLIGNAPSGGRSEEHTSELQSLMRRSYAVFCLKKKKPHDNESNNYTYYIRRIRDNTRTN